MKKVATLLVTLLILAGIAYLLAPPPLTSAVTAIDIPADIASLPDWLAEREAQVSARYELIPDTEKRLRWFDGARRTRYAVIYLHGFSATRQETAPVAERVAKALGANLFETRLSGHGHRLLPMDKVKAEDWLQDGAEALTVGSAIGDELIVIGTSTGATLALAMNGHELMEPVSTLAFISPNFAPADPASAWLTGPAGPQLANLMIGETRTWTPHNERQGRYWSTSYPTRAVVEVMRLVDRANDRKAHPMTLDVLFFASDNDAVLSPQAMRDGFEAMRPKRKEYIAIEATGDPSNHVLAGDILSPQTNTQIVDAIVDFVSHDQDVRQ